MLPPTALQGSGAAAKAAGPWGGARRGGRLTQPGGPCGHQTGPWPERARGGHTQAAVSSGAGGATPTTATVAPFSAPKSWPWDAQCRCRNAPPASRLRGSNPLPAALTCEEEAARAATPATRPPSTARRLSADARTTTAALQAGGEAGAAGGRRHAGHAGGQGTVALVCAVFEAMCQVIGTWQAALLWAGCQAAVPCCSCRSWRAARQRISARLHPSGISRPLRLPSASVCPHRVLTERRGGWWRLQGRGQGGNGSQATWLEQGPPRRRLGGAGGSGSWAGTRCQTHLWRYKAAVDSPERTAEPAKALQSKRRGRGERVRSGWAGWRPAGAPVRPDPRSLAPANAVRCA